MGEGVSSRSEGPPQAPEGPPQAPEGPPQAPDGPPLLFRDVRVVSPAPAEPGPDGPPGYLRGSDAGRLDVIEHAEVLVADGVVRWIRSTTEDAPPSGPTGVDVPPATRTIEGRGRVLLPGFVDAHTHACWAGDRLDEWEAGLSGATYQELLAAGGGILATVRAVREASEDDLTERLLGRLGWMLREGTTTVEVKSGYGLSTDAELKMLRAIRRAGDAWAGTVVATACLGHAKDPGDPDFVERTIKETLPAVHEAFPGVAVDAYCEEGAWSVDECVALFEAAREMGHPLRVHADQFTSLGMVSEAVRLGARSVDHLEATTPAELRLLAESSAAGVLLPVSGFHLDARYADGRAFVDAGGAPVVATNYNPGSAPSPAIPFAVALAVRECGLLPGEALTAVTANGAALLGFGERGRVAPGLRADLVLLRHIDERELARTVGGSPVDVVVAGGRVVQG
jgi:imidazolonepropionase